MEEVRKNFNYRAFYSIGLLVSGLSLPLSGFINHELQLEQLTPIREFWMTVHNSAGILFFVLAIFHLVLNRKVVSKHLQKAKGAMISKEAVLAIVFVVLIVISVSLHVFI